MFIELIAFGLFVLLVAGAVAGVYGVFAQRALHSRLTELEDRVSELEAGRRRAAEPAIEVAREARTRREVRATPLASPPESCVDRSPDTDTGIASGATLRLPRPSRSTDFSLESLIAGRWLNRIGVVAVLLATAFFLKFAFDSDWVGPRGRVAIGLVAGASLLVASQWLLRNGYRYFSEGIAALGAGVLFLSFFAAWDFYQLIPEGAAFAGMVIVTAALAALARGRDSERLGVLALLAGLSTPMLLSTGVDRQIALFSYLAILIGVFLTLGWDKRWRWIQPVGWLGFIVYLIGWFDRFYQPAKLGMTLLVVTLFFVAFAIPQVATVLSRKRMRVEEMLLVIVNAAWLGVALHVLLYDEHRWWLTVAVLALGVLHLVVARSARDSEGGEDDELGRPRVARYLYAAVALGFVTAAVPIRLEGEWIRIAWAIEGSLLVWAGSKGRVEALRVVGVGLMLLAGAMLLDSSGAGDRLLLNTRFLSFAVVAGSLAASVVWVRPRAADFEAAERNLFAGVGVAANAVAVWGLSEEVWRFLGRQQWDLEPRLARQMGLSVLWAILAAALIVVGIKAKSSVLRWEGLVLVGITVLKVFLLDLSFLERGYRIASLLALGMVLLIVSFLYQKSQRGARGVPE